MWRLPSERITLDLDGPTVEVERLRAWHVQFEGLSLLSRYVAASTPQTEYVALNALFEYVVREAQPQWDIGDHLGSVPATARGMARLPLDLSLAIASLWLSSLEGKPEVVEAERQQIAGLQVVESQAPSAVDAVIPPGPLNREIKRRLREKKAA